MPHDGPGLPRSAKTGGRYQAYLPNKLSSLHLSLPDELVDNIATAERRLLSLTRTETALGLEGIARFLMRSEAISSSRIEGIAPALTRSHWQNLPLRSLFMVFHVAPSW